MKTELIDHSPTQKELKIEIDAAAVRAEYDRVSDRYARQASVPGFRKGHAPREVVRRRFRDEIRGDVLQALVPQAIQDAILRHELRVLGDPEIHFDNEESVGKLGEGSITLRAHVEVVPEVTLGQYKGIEAARRVRPVTDESVEETLRNLRESSASLQPVEDRGAEVGDTVTVNFTGRYIDPPSEEEIKVDDVDVVLGGEGVVREFTDNLSGVRADDVRVFRVKYPEDFSAKGLAGKEIEYTATVTAVRRKELPALDDEWAQSLGEEGIDSLERLRERVRENLTSHARYESEQRLRGEVMSALVGAHQFEVPESLVHHQAQELLKSTARDMMRRGIDPRQQEVDWQQLGELLRPQAADDLRGSLLLERVAEAENIEVSDEEIEAEIDAVAQATRQTPEQVRAALTKQGGERSIADRLRHRKALDLIVANAKVRDEEWREEEESPREGGGAPGGESRQAAAASEQQG